LNFDFETVTLGNAVTWCVSVIIIAIILQESEYFLPVVLILCIAAMISIILVAKATKRPKSKEWYEGE
jgi:flagellar biosynthesis component FlhA